MGRIAGRFARVEHRRRTGRLVLGLLSDLPHKNCWSIAEWAGESSPHGMQHLLSRAVWDADAVRDDVREYVVEHLHDEAAVLLVDETGDVKKGTRTVAVQRQYTGTAGSCISITARCKGVGVILRCDCACGRSGFSCGSEGEVRSIPSPSR